ncbi:hypothetical protein [Streptomyces sp. SID13726]|uniref:hypothetical protein n=1 Tax=Streptomyces sp. SID13726 TaxID=2706058 RepID=UPI0013BE0317|nr:hypothetical protein [Streptomyces sp. SID13726]NEB04504.1 hypothetical protein [Streptomyces sp. SID13726]
MSVMAGSVALSCPGDTGDYASTPDAAALDVTGDIDVRIDATLNNWLDTQSDTTGFDTVELIAKHAGSPNKSWMFAVRDYALYVEWSADGTNVLSASSTVPLPAGPDTRMAVRFTLDVDNGASGNTVTFYTADTLSGTWVQLGDPVTQAGTTSIANTTAALRVGDASSFGFGRAAGLIHAAQVRNGIAGTIVANPDFSAQTAGATTFADSAGRTWTLAGNTSLTTRKVRFVGEVSEWPAEWDVSGKDVYTQVTASGILRRLSQGNSPIKSTLTRRIPSLGPVAYWPMEDGATSTVAYSAVDGVDDMTTSGLAFAANDTLAGSSALPTISAGAQISASIPPQDPADPTSWQVEFVFNLDAITSNYRTILKIQSTGTVKNWYLQVSGSTLARVLGYDDDNNLVVSDARVVGSDISDGRWNRWRHIISESAGTVSYQTTWINVGGAGGSASGSYSGSVGRVQSLMSPPDGYSSELGSMAIGHIGVFYPSQSSAYSNVDTGQNGERAGARLARLAGEEAIPMSVCGDPGIQAQLGPQKPAALLDILRDSAEADGGILYEQRQAAGLMYRDASSLYNQRVRLALNYTTAGHVAPPFQPVDDDQLIKNDITVSRRDGASAVSELTSGALSTQAPPNGVGRYQDSRDLNLYDDTQPAQAAEWLLHLGTWDEARYPTLHVDLAAGPSLIDDVTAADVGDRATVSNPPSWLPPDAIDLLIQGYSEVIQQYAWDVTFNCTPGAPWSSIAQVGTARADTAGSHLSDPATSSATTIYVTTETGPEWVDSSDSASDFPFDIRVAGERMTVSACRGNGADTFGRTVSNGWGTADVGGTYGTGGGTTADYAVGSGIGTHTLATVNTSRRTFLSTTFTDFDIYVSIATSALATGGFLSGGITGRHVDSDNLYTARAAFNQDQGITLSIRKRLAGVETELEALSIPALTHVAGTFYRMRFQGIGIFLKAKLWLASADEPLAWDRETFDSALTASSFQGLRSISASANTNTNPVIRYDDFRNILPQAMTVTRSVNGVTKAQSADSAVSLWTPYYVPYL